MRIMLKAAMISITVALSGCMTQQGGQQSEFGQAMMSGLAQGLLSGAGASLGHGIATGSKRHLAAAAAQAALGTAATAAQVSAAQANHERSHIAFNAPDRLGSDKTSLPATPQCKAYIRYIKTAPSMGDPRYKTYSYESFAHYHNCLNSAPSHPTSIKLRCGPGKYYGYFMNYEKDGATKRICGLKEARAFLF